MATIEEINVNGKQTEVIAFSHTAQEIDEVVDKVPAVGAAPDGFGLGGIAGKTLTTIAEVDEFKVGGTAYVDFSGKSDRIEGQAFGILDCAATPRFFKQTFSFYYAQRGGLCKLERIFYIYSNVNWTPWEWVNPPMLSGEEYRTIERRFGIPVYTRMITADFNTPGVIRKTEIQNVGAKRLVGFSSSVDNWSIPTTTYGGVTNDDGFIDCSARVNNDGSLCVYTVTKTRDLTSKQAVIQIWYTKE